MIVENGTSMERWKALQAAPQSDGGALQSELIEARDGAIICDLSDAYGLLQIDGEDAETFLHAQLSSDVSALRPDQAQLSTYNSPKGRVLATLLLWRAEQGFLVQLPAAVEEPVRRRLSMYILRSKVRIRSAKDRLIAIGVGGPHAAHLLNAANIGAPREPRGVLREERVHLANQPLTIDYIVRHADDRYQLLISDEEKAIAVWHALHGHGAQTARAAAWRWLTLSAGVAEIGADTQDQFVAQMLNYELIGGISFSKGCYPGQEIIARTQYRGSIKRRTLLAHVDDATEPAPGDSIFGEAGDAQAIGTVVNCAPSPQGGFDMLVSVHMELAGGRLHLGKSDGPLVAPLRMPYSIPAPA